MERQLEMVDVEGMTLLMHASSGCCDSGSSSASAVFQALSQTVQPSQVGHGGGGGAAAR